MKRKILRILTAASALLGAAGAINFQGIAGALPPEWSRYLIVAALGCLGVKELAVVIGDLIDDGNRNDSFK